MPDCTLPVNNSKVIAPWMYKLDLQPLSPKHRKNMEVHVDYLKQTKEHADILRDIVEQARALQPLDNSLDYACKFTTFIQELFIYVSATCPSSLDKSEILVVFKPMNTRVKSSTSTSGSKPSGNSKKNKISTKHAMLDANSKFVCSTCNECLFNACHDMCVVDLLNDMNVRAKSRWLPIGRTFTIDGNKCPLTRITSTTIVPPKKPVPAKVVKKTPPRRNNLGKPKATTSVSSSRTDRPLRGLDTIDFHLGQFSESNLEVAFQKHTCFVHDLEGVDLLMSLRGKNLYTLSLEDMMRSSPICLLSKVSKTKSWLWHRRLSYLNFGTINQLAKQGLVRGLPKLKYVKDHLCSACSLGKSKKHTHKPKSEDTIQEKLYLLHMNLCGPMRVESINGKKYILVIVDDYSRFTWVKFLRSKDETLEFIIKFQKKVQVC
ncbi:retrovirus-related pol polyprotein from transposon TNT 1-94 [Tanacetum coccineum]